MHFFPNNVLQYALLCSCKSTQLGCFRIKAKRCQWLLTMHVGVTVSIAIIVLPQCYVLSQTPTCSQCHVFRKYSLSLVSLHVCSYNYSQLICRLYSGHIWLRIHTYSWNDSLYGYSQWESLYCAAMHTCVCLRSNALSCWFQPTRILYTVRCTDNASHHIVCWAACIHGL